jgi:hypothetical protein
VVTSGQDDGDGETDTTMANARLLQIVAADWMLPATMMKSRASAFLGGGPQRDESASSGSAIDALRKCECVLNSSALHEYRLQEP